MRLLWPVIGCRRTGLTPQKPLWLWRAGYGVAPGRVGTERPNSAAAVDLSAEGSSGAACTVGVLLLSLSHHSPDSFPPPAPAPLLHSYLRIGSMARLSLAAVLALAFAPNALAVEKTVALEGLKQIAELKSMDMDVSLAAGSAINHHYRYLPRPILLPAARTHACDPTMRSAPTRWKALYISSPAHTHTIIVASLPVA